MPRADTQFRSGQSGNPAGRPKICPELKSAARIYTMEALDTLVHIMRTGRDQARVQAANAILDRAWGKPEQSVEVKDTAQLSLVELLVELSHGDRITKTNPTSNRLSINC